MHQFTIIKEIVIILLVSLPIIYFLKKINVPSILGFLAAGMVIGPYGLHLISDIENIQVMAEVGVILLLFTIGLEVSFGKLVKMRRMLFYAGLLQIVFTILITALIFYLFGIPLNKAVFYGMLISLSSTAIVLKLLQDRGELETPFGRISIVILIFQDLAVVPMLILLPVLGGGESFTLTRIILQLIYALVSIAIIVLLAKFLMPKILYHLARLKIREAFTVGTILLLLGTAYLTHLIGLSFAIGAFIAGLILSESDFSHQVTADILPLKDAFNSIFFVSIGLLLNLKFVYDYFFLMIALTAGIIILKTSVVLLLIKAMKYPFRIAIIAGLSLSQVGEFSFVLSQSGLTFNLIGNEFYNAFLASSIFTMLLTPLLIKLAPVLGYGAGGIKVSKQKPLPKPGIENHVIIVGFGLNGRNLARVLKETGIEYLVVEINPETVKEEKSKGENIIYGDTTREEILQTAGAGKASVIVFAISDPFATKVALKNAKRINPEIYSVVRTRYTNEIDELKSLGADEVIPEEFETSLQIFSKVLEKFHIPLNIIMKQASLLRGESYSMMREKGAAASLVNLNEILAAGLTETFYVDENNIHAGKTMKELNLRAETGVTIIAIVRDDTTITNPASDEKILEKDTLVITGTHKTVDDAINYLGSDVNKLNKN